MQVLDDLYIDFALGFRVQCKSNNVYKIKLYDNYTDILHQTFITT